jgi:FKBP-type peptidyl-prolyl cis-trans isomerase FklB
MKIESLQEKISYVIGRDMVQNLSRQGIEINSAAFTKGLEDALSGKPSELTNEQTQQVMRQLQEQVSQRQQQQAGQKGESNKQEGEQFLAQNKNQEGVVTLPSGLQYQILKEGSGKTPSRHDRVTTHYHGTLIDGTVFDSSYERGQPATFPVSGVIAGWTEALQLMQEGAKWRLFIPSNLAYGSQGAGQDIGPNTALIFDVELISVN